MHTIKTHRTHRLAIIAVALMTIMGATACGGKAKKADRAPTEKRVLQTQAPPPTTEVLKDSPCGNPDWARPPGSAGEEAADTNFRATDRKKSADKKADEKSARPADKSENQENTTDPAEKPAEPVE